MDFQESRRCGYQLQHYGPRNQLLAARCPEQRVQHSCGYLTRLQPILPILPDEAPRKETHVGVELFQEQAQDKLSRPKVRLDDQLLPNGRAPPIQR